MDQEKEREDFETWWRRPYSPAKPMNGSGASAVSVHRTRHDAAASRACQSSARASSPAWAAARSSWIDDASAKMAA